MSKAVVYIVYEFYNEGGEIRKIFHSFNKAIDYCRENYKKQLRTKYEQYREQWFNEWEAEGVWGNAPQLLNYPEWEEEYFDSDELIHEWEVL